MKRESSARIAAKLLAIAIFAAPTISLAASNAKPVDPSFRSDSLSSNETADKRYFYGILLLKQGDNQAAYDYFASLQRNETDNDRINLYMGLALMRLTRYEEAIAAFERVLIKNPNHAQSKFQIAKCQFALKQDSEAAKLFAEIINDRSVPNEVKQSANLYLSAISQRRKKNFLNVQAAIGVGYDTNVYYDAGEDRRIISPNLYIGGLFKFPDELSFGNKEIKDSLHQESLTLNHIYDFGNPAGFSQHTDLQAFNQMFFNEDRANLLFLTAGTGLGYISEGGNRIVGKVFIDKLTYAKEDYSEQIGFKLTSAIVFKDSKYALEPFIQISQKTNEIDEGKDADLLDFSIALNEFEKETYTSYSISAGDEDAKEDIGNSKQYFGFSAQRAWLFNALTAHASLGYKFYIYKEKVYNLSNMGELEKRKEHNVQLGLGASYRIASNFNAGLNYQYMLNNSNFEAFSWDKHLVFLNLIYRTGI